MSRIEIQDVSKTFRENKVIDHVSASFSGGKIIGLIGRNGSGKTVLFKMICGLMPVDSGEIRVNGEILGRVIIYRNLHAFAAAQSLQPTLVRLLRRRAFCRWQAVSAI